MTDVHADLVASLAAAKAEHASKRQPRRGFHPNLTDPDWCGLPGQDAKDCSGFSDGDWSELGRRRRAVEESVDTEEAAWGRAFACDDTVTYYAPRVGQRGRRIGGQD